MAESIPETADKKAPERDSSAAGESSGTIPEKAEEPAVEKDSETTAQPAAEEGAEAIVAEVAEAVAAQAAEGAAEEAAEGAAEEAAFELRPTTDRLAVLLDCDISEETFEKILARALEELEGLGLSRVPARHAVEELLRKEMEAGPQLKDVCLLKGVDPVPSQDGEIIWERDYFSTDYVVDEVTGAIDYRRFKGDPNVEQGEALARVTEPVNGQSGIDIYGRAVPVTKGRSARLRMGSNVRCEKRNGVDCYLAEAAGRARWQGSTLFVDDTYTISGNVGIATGDISHPGSVVVRGDVEEGSRVEAKGDIDIAGAVEPCDLRAGGNLIVRGGVTGDEDSLIEVGGTFKARFVNEARIEAGGDVEVESETINCQIQTRGSVDVSRGRIAGGRTVAMRGISVGQAGSVGLVPTNLVAGEDFMLPRKLKAKRKEVKQLEGNLEKVHKILTPYVNNPASITADKRQAVAKMAQMAKDIKAKIENVQAEMERVCKASADKAVYNIQIHKIVYPEARLHLKNAALHVKETFKGPIRAILSQKGKIRLLAESETDTEDHS